MATPKIIIFAQGGTHGDFLYSCGLLMLGKKEPTIDANGKVIEESISKRINLKSFYKGKKDSVFVKPANKLEIYHIWQEEFKQIEAKFYYIDYTDNQIDIIKKMYLEKVHNNNLSNALKSITQYLPENLSIKISERNFDKILTLSYKNTIKKYKQQPGIIPIPINHLYDFDSLVVILKDMNLLKKHRLDNLKQFHYVWTTKNKKWMTEMLNLNK